MPITLRGQSVEIRLSNEEGHLIEGLSRRRRYRENANLRDAIEYAQQMIREQNDREPDVTEKKSLFDPLICRPVVFSEEKRTWLLIRKTRDGWILVGALYEAEEEDRNLAMFEALANRAKNERGI
jgi:hypothetical protein